MKSKKKIEKIYKILEDLLSGIVIDDLGEPTISGGKIEKAVKKLINLQDK